MVIDEVRVLHMMVEMVLTEVEVGICEVKLLLHDDEL